MSLRALGGIASRLYRSRRIMEATDRAFLALREETRRHKIDNDAVAKLWELADAVAESAVDAGIDASPAEAELIGRVRAALGEQLTASGDVRRAIITVRELAHLLP